MQFAPNKTHQSLLAWLLHHSELVHNHSEIFIDNFAGRVKRAAQQTCSVVSVAGRASHRCWQTQCVSVKGTLASTGAAYENML